MRFVRERPGLPHWDGDPPGGRRLLVYQEQRLGDTIQFARYLPLRNRGARITLDCAAALKPLLSASRDLLGVERVIAGPERGEAYDAQVPLWSLPHLLREYDPIPRGLPFPYLIVPEGAASPLPPAPEGKQQVAIAWLCNKDSPDHATRSCPIAVFGPLAARPDCQLVSVQKEGFAQMTCAGWTITTFLTWGRSLPT